MANTKAHFLVLATLVMVGTLILNDQMVSGECHGGTEFMTQCSKFIQIAGPKVPPSQECCQVVKTLDVTCTCQLVTPIVEKKISMEKVVYVARTCGLVVKPGTKCGSYTVGK